MRLRAGSFTRDIVLSATEIHILKHCSVAKHVATHAFGCNKKNGPRIVGLMPGSSANTVSLITFTNLFIKLAVFRQPENILVSPGVILG